MSLDHSVRHTIHLTSLVEFGSCPFQDGGIENHFTETQRLFFGQTKLLTTKQRIIS